MNSIRLPRRAAAEFFGTALLACILVGSGIAAERLSIDPGLRLLENTIAVVAVTMAAYLGAASWFTSSFGLPNPALTVGRILTDTYAGVAPVSALLYPAAQLIGTVFGLIATVVLFPAASAAVIDDEQMTAAA